MSMKFIVAAAAASFALLPAAANAATVVNVNGISNASFAGANAVTTSLAAGTYELSFIKDTFTAFSRFSSSSGCDTNGSNCSRGWENSVRYIIGSDTFSFGDGAASGGIGPISPGDGYFVDADTSFANSGAFKTTFLLTGPTDVKFFIYDDILTDNRGGISLSISAVPEPATWAMSILGFGLIGFSMRRRKGMTENMSFA